MRGADVKEKEKQEDVGGRRHSNDERGARKSLKTYGRFTESNQRNRSTSNMQRRLS